MMISPWASAEGAAAASRPRPVLRATADLSPTHPYAHHRRRKMDQSVAFQSNLTRKVLCKTGGKESDSKSEGRKFSGAPQSSLSLLLAPSPWPLSPLPLLISLERKHSWETSSISTSPLGGRGRFDFSVIGTNMFC